MYQMEMPMTIKPSTAIIGAGPAGLMLARLLALRGFEPVIFERDRHAGDRPQGGSLDLHSDTGQLAVRLAGLEKEFAAAARPEDQGDRLYDQNGHLLFDRDGAGDDRPEIDRTELRRILLDALALDVVRWGSKVDEIAPRAHGCDVTINGSSEHFDIVVGADGAWSRVRTLLTEAKPAYEGATLVEFGFDTTRHPDVDALTGTGKMFAVGDNRILITQRNGHGHIRGYAGVRIDEQSARQWVSATPDRVRNVLRDAFTGWAPRLLDMIESGDFIAVRPLYALPIGLTWNTRPGVTLLGDAAHLMSPFSGEGVNLALADAVDLADAIASSAGWDAITTCEFGIMERAKPSAEGAAGGLAGAVSSDGPGPVLEHYLERTRDS
jgi:2-polyprenyl-6-methoxyphenol hydroxylase-like FAD-dependent oxidoreductase